MEVFKQLVESGRADDAFILARYMYRVGEPVIDDVTYEDFAEKVRGKFPQLETFFGRTYDEDPVPETLLAEFGLQVVDAGSADSTEDLQKLFGEDKSLSIRSVTQYREAWDFFHAHRVAGNDIFVAIKVDGNNTREVYKGGEFRLSLSRGRNTDTCFDFTHSMKKVLPGRLVGVTEEFVLYGEAYVEEAYLPKLRAKYHTGDKFKTARTTAMSMLRLDTYDEEDYSHLKFKAFSAPGMRKTVSETYQLLESLGFETPPHKLIRWQELPEDFSSFSGWLDREVFAPLSEYQSEIASDGIVAEVNQYDWLGEVNGNYSTRQLALKFGPWNFTYVKGIVSDIVVQQRRVLACVKIAIEPLTTQDGCEARVINVFNPDILINAGLRKGSTVYFERNSGAVNILLHGKKLELVLNEGGILADE